MVTNELEAIATQSLAESMPEDVKPKQLTESEIKAFRRAYVTVRNSEVIECGHSFHQIDPPRNNCDQCWVAYFQVHGEVTQTADEVFQKHGRKVLEGMWGKKWVKNWLRFMVGLAVLQAEQSKGKDE